MKYTCIEHCLSIRYMPTLDITERTLLKPSAYTRCDSIVYIGVILKHCSNGTHV